MRGKRSTLTLVAVVLTVVVAGCAGFSAPDDADATTTPVNGTNATTTPADGTNATTTSTGDEPSYRLKLTSDANASVAVTLVAASSNETALNETYELQSGESIDLSDELDADTDYELTMRAANETLEKRINADAAYTYRVTSGEELELAGYVSG